jgi:hypothetical protein
MSARKDSVLDRRLRRLSSVIVIVGAVAALLAATRVSFALGSQTVQGKTLQYNVRFVRDSQIDLGARGPSIGDERTFYDVLFDQNGERVGYEGGVCAVESMSPPVFSCSVTFSLSEGQIATQLLTSPETVRHHRRLGQLPKRARRRNTGRIRQTERQHHLPPRRPLARPETRPRVDQIASGAVRSAHVTPSRDPRSMPSTCGCPDTTRNCC